MNQRAIMGGAFAAVAVIAGVVYWNVSNQAAENSRRAAEEKRQKDNDAKMEAMQKELRELGAARAAQAGPATGSGMGVAQTASAIGRQNDINQALAVAGPLINSGDADKAQTAANILQEAIDKVDAGNPDLYAALGRADLVMKHFPQATQVFKKGLELKPQRVDLWVGIGSAYWGVKDYYHAKVAFDQAIALDPNCVEAWSVMAWVYMGLKEKDKSVKGFQVLVDSGADRMDWKTGLTMARAGNADIGQIRSLFPMPDPALFNPPATKP